MSRAIPPPTPAAKPLRRRLWLVCGVLGALVLLGWSALRNDSQPPEPDGPAADSQDTDAAARDRELARGVLGQWHDNYMGTKRTMTLREDGSGEMLVEVSGVGAVLFASRLRFDMEWSVRNGRLVQHSLGGEPEAAVRALLKAMGDRVDQPILELTADRMLLEHENGQTHLDWRRTP